MRFKSLLSRPSSAFARDKELLLCFKRSLYSTGILPSEEDHISSWLGFSLTGIYCLTERWVNCLLLIASLTLGTTLFKGPDMRLPRKEESPFRGTFFDCLDAAPF